MRMYTQNISSTYFFKAFIFSIWKYFTEAKFKLVKYFIFTWWYLLVWLVFKTIHVRIPYTDIYLKCRLFFRRFKKGPWNLSFYTSPTSDSDANGHRPHYKTSLFFTRLGFIQAIILIRSNSKWCITDFTDLCEEDLLVFILYCNIVHLLSLWSLRCFLFLQFSEKWNHGSYRNVHMRKSINH